MDPTPRLAEASAEGNMEAAMDPKCLDIDALKTGDTERWDFLLPQIYTLHSQRKLIMSKILGKVGKKGQWQTRILHTPPSTLPPVSVTT